VEIYPPVALKTPPAAHQAKESGGAFLGRGRQNETLLEARGGRSGATL
jgi:hypothetical protein